MNSSKLLALGLVLFLGGCSLSATDEAFLDKVKGKTVYSDAEHNELGKQGVFSTDGKKWTQNLSSMTLEFSEASDENSGTYKFTIAGSTLTGTFVTVDGKEGSMLLESSVSSTSIIDVFYN